MANQVIVTANNTVQVAIEPTPQVQVQISRAAIGNVSNLIVNVANYANFAGNAFSVTLSNVVGAGNIASINLNGNVNDVLRGDGTFAPEGTSGNANYANFAGTAFSVSGSNVSGTVANATYADNAGNANVANTATNANTANIANIAYSVDGANVNGAVANATYAANAGYSANAGNANIANIAYSVSVGNVSGIGNIATVNLDGNTSNVLKGDGTFGPEGSTGNANYANFAGTAFSVSGSNVSGAVANATYADNAGNANIANTAYSVSGANVSGTVANATFADDAANANIANTAYSVDVANVSGIGNIATINLDGNVANALLGDGTFGPVELDTANYANFAGNAFSVDGANVNGAVANATYATSAGSATTAGTVTTNAQPNITSLGTLNALNVNASNAIVLSSNNAVTLFTSDVANLNNIGPTVSYSNPVTGNTTSLTAGAAGATVFIANSTPGNSFPGNVKAIWAFDTAGNLNHSFGGIGNINPKGLTTSGNVNAGRFTATGNVQGNIVVANYLYGDGSNITNINGSNVTNTVANANYAAYAGNITVAAQPNITSVGTLTGLTVNTTANANIQTNNSNIQLNVTESANLGTTINMTQRATWSNNLSSLFAGAPGVSVYISNTAAGNTGFGNIKSYWSFDNNGNLGHVFGGTGNVNAKGLAVGTGNITGGTIGLSANSTGSAITVNQQGNGGATSYNMYSNTSVFTVQNFYRTRGNSAVRTAVGNNDTVFTQNYSAYIDSGNTFYTLGYQENKIGTNYGNGSASFVSTLAATAPDSIFQVLGYSQINLNGNISTPNTVNISSGNIVLNNDGRIDYLRTYGSFTSNATQTSNGANTTNYMTLNNTEDANGVSIVSSSQITVARTGRYNIQFSTVLTHDTNQTANVEIWLTKNGSAVANTNTRLTIAKDQATAAAWNFVDNASTANTYYQLAWASPDTNVELLAVDTANTISGVAIPSVIVTVTPVGA